MSVSAASDSARCPAPRALGRRCVHLVRTLTLLLLAAAMLPFGAARAQTMASNGQIYIPGPGETHAAQSSGAMIAIPGPGESQGAASAASAPNSAATNGTIVIPGRVMPVLITAPQRATGAAQPIAVEQPANSRFAPQAAAARAPARAAAQAPVAPVAPVAPIPSATPAAAELAPASNVPAGQQDGESIRRAALAFLQQQTLGLPGKIAITVAPTFPRGLAACATLEPFMPTGARLWGTTSVGVRCAGARPWTLYLQARIAIESTYYLAARQIEPGTVVTTQDLLAREGNLANLPRAIITDPQQAIGATATVRIGAGMPLRQDLLKSASAVTIGQTVHVVAKGEGFQISSDGSAMNNAAPGQQVRVKMGGGQIISGIVLDGATVKVQM